MGGGGIIPSIRILSAAPIFAFTLHGSIVVAVREVSEFWSSCHSFLEFWYCFPALLSIMVVIASESHAFECYEIGFIRSQASFSEGIVLVILWKNMK